MLTKEDVEEIRRKPHPDKWRTYGPTLADAVDTLRSELAKATNVIADVVADRDELCTENERLRAALKPLAEMAPTNDEFGSHCEFCGWSDESYDAEPEHRSGCAILAARAALSQT